MKKDYHFEILPIDSINVNLNVDFNETIRVRGTSNFSFSEKTQLEFKNVEAIFDHIKEIANSDERPKVKVKQLKSFLDSAKIKFPLAMEVIVEHHGSDCVLLNKDDKKNEIYPSSSREDIYRELIKGEEELKENGNTRK